VTQTGDPQFRNLDFRWFPDLKLLFDGRNSLRALTLPEGVRIPRRGCPGAHEARRRAGIAHDAYRGPWWGRGRS